MTNIRILCNCPINHLPEAKQILESVGEVTYAEYKYPQLLQVIGGFDTLLPSLDVRLDEKMLMCAKRLKLIATPSTGTDHIDLKSAEKMGIKVISLKGEYELLKKITATAELTIGLLLALVRRIPFAFDCVKQGKWSSQDFRGNELFGKTLGIIGYGRLGEMVARYANSFGMQVIAYDPYKTIQETSVKQVDFEALLHSADIITLHVHLNDETKGLISEKAFSLMKDGVYIINTSRGAVIDEGLLLEALQSGKVKGAALDVLAGECEGKLQNHPLIGYARNHSNLIITPHIGGVTYESQKKAYTLIAQKIKEFYATEKYRKCS